MVAVSMPRLRAGLVCLIAMAACAFPTGDSWEISMEVTGESAAPNPPGRLITFAVVNRSNETHWVPRCGDRISVAVERLDAQWVSHEAAICPANLPADPIQIEPGAEVVSQKVISGAGLFRLRSGQRNNLQREMTWNVVSRTIEIPD
jgi:hypothetical protein